MTDKKKKTPAKIKARVGEIYLVKTFAGPKVYQKIIGTKDEEKGWYESVLVRQQDIDALRDASVAYPPNATPENVCPGTAFKFAIIRKITNFKKEIKRTYSVNDEVNEKELVSKKRKFRKPEEILRRVKVKK